MTWNTPDLAAALAAGRRLGLVVDEGRPEFLCRRPVDVGGPSAHVLKVPPLEPRAYLRLPSEVGVYASGVCVADLVCGGFGLDAFVGAGGEKFAAAYALSAVLLLAPFRPAVRLEAGGGVAVTITVFEEDAVARKVVVRVAKDGKVSAQVEGVAGPSCSDLLARINRAAGAQVEAEQLTPEYAAEAEAVAQPEGG